MTCLRILLAFIQCAKRSTSSTVYLTYGRENTRYLVNCGLHKVMIAWQNTLNTSNLIREKSATIKRLALKILCFCLGEYTNIDCIEIFPLYGSKEYTLTDLADNRAVAFF